jgi:GNAT superfamily N-acetyltransferase
VSPEPEPRVRPAGVADCEALARLRFEFRSGIAPSVEGETEFLARCYSWMRERLGQPSPWQCWVAEQGDEVVGCLWLQSIEKVPNPVAESEQHAYITNVYVRPERRGAGIGGALMGAAIAWCRARSVDSLILWPTDESRTLYERLGFEAAPRLLELTLASGAGGEGPNR